MAHVYTDILPLLSSQQSQLNQSVQSSQQFTQQQSKKIQIITKESQHLEKYPNLPKTISVSVFSGLCNRLFVILSALHVQEQCGHTVVVYWLERTGRYGLPYYGDLVSQWEDYFYPVPSMITYSGNETIQFDVTKNIDLNQEQTLPENLPMVDIAARAAAVNAAESAVTNGSGCSTNNMANIPLNIIPSTDIAQTKEKNVRKVMTGDMVAFLFGHKYVDEKKDQIVVSKFTKPFGMKGIDSPHLTKYINYVTDVRVHVKDSYLEGLSRCAKLLKPVFHNVVIENLVNKFKQFKEVWGIHIRGTDLSQMSTVDRKASIMNIVNRAPFGVGFFVATDEPMGWVKSVIPVDNLISYNCKLKYENSIEGAQHAIVDLFVLSKCHKLFGTSGSSFSMMAWILSDSPIFTIHS